MALPDDFAVKFAEDGYYVMESFLTEEETSALKKECHDMVEEMDPAEHQSVFSTTKQTYRNNYFIESADKIGYFFEEGALDEKGNLKVDKQKCLNKIGHAMHVLCPNFKKITFSTKVQDILKKCSYEDPVVFQSMYIFKQPGIGGEVVPHQDGTFLYTEPLKVMGIWIALEDTTKDNGCLWFIPGSHKEGLHGKRRMVRSKKEEGPSCIFTSEPVEYDNEKFVPVPIKKGSAIIIDGLVVHKSEHNHSDKSRHIYTFHIYDQAVAKYDKDNWLQPTSANTFCRVYGE